MGTRRHRAAQARRGLTGASDELGQPSAAPSGRTGDASALDRGVRVRAGAGRVPPGLTPAAPRCSPSASVGGRPTPPALGSPGCLSPPTRRPSARSGWRYSSPQCCSFARSRTAVSAGAPLHTREYAIAWVVIDKHLKGVAVEHAKADVVQTHAHRIVEQRAGDHFTYTKRAHFKHPPGLVSARSR